MGAIVDQSELRMNLVAIKRVDPYANDIVDTSNHVAFYTFNADESEWEKTDVEGAFFIYSRNAEPFYSVFIHNRLNTMPLVEPITHHIELQSQPPFLLYRNERARIRGFWFYNSTECVRIGELIGRLVKECEAKVSGQQHNMVSAIMQKQQPNVDIFTLLSKAQEDFNNTGGGNGGPQLKFVDQSKQLQMPPLHLMHQQLQHIQLPPHPQLHHHQQQQQQQPDVTSSVMNFFAAAKQPVAAPASDVPIFKRLMSAPAHPMHVEQIEKQHRALTPLNNLQEPGKASPITNLMHQHSQQPPQTIEAIENGLKFIRVTSPGLHPIPNNGNISQKDLLGTSPLANFLSSSNLVGGNRNAVPNATDVSDLEFRHHQQQQQQQTMQPLHMLLKRAESHQPTTNGGAGQMANKPALMPPTMFQSPVSASTTTTTNVTQLLKSSAGDGNQPRNVPENKIEASYSSIVASAVANNNNNNINSGNAHKPEPLTQNQFISAMNYLMQHDGDFIKRLHEAYLKSFTETITTK